LVAADDRDVGSGAGRDAAAAGAAGDGHAAGGNDRLALGVGDRLAARVDQDAARADAGGGDAAAASAPSGVTMRRTSGRTTISTTMKPSRSITPVSAPRM